MQTRRCLPVVVIAASLCACTSGTPQADAPRPRLDPPVISTGRSASGPSPPAAPSIAGCPLFPADNPWRRNVSEDPVSVHSAAWVASNGSGGFLHADFGSAPGYGIPYSVVPAGQPRVAITVNTYANESDPGPFPIPPNAKVEAGGDRHVLVASGDCHLYELYGAVRHGSGWAAAASSVFNLESNALRPDGWTSADAAGLPILPGLVRRDEVSTGHIEHALRFTLAHTQRGYIHPATHQAGLSSSVDLPPMGARFRLKSSFDITRFRGDALVILRCLQTYGMFLADNGSNWFLSGASDSGWDDEGLHQLTVVPASAFEVVDTGPVRS